MLAKSVKNFTYVLAALLLSACSNLQSLQEPDISLTGLAIKSFKLDQQELQLRFDVVNPNNRELLIKSMDYALAVGGARLAAGKHTENIHLAANSEQSIAIAVTTYLNDALPLLAKAMSQPGKPLDYVFDIKVHLSRPIPYTYNVSRDGSVRLF